MPIRGFTQWGPHHTEIGPAINSATPNATHPIHHVITTATLTTIYPPLAILRDALELVLIADSAFSWDASGNIANVNGTTLCLDSAVIFIYDRQTGKWYPVMGTDCGYRGPQ